MSSLGARVAALRRWALTEVGGVGAIGVAALGALGFAAIADEAHEDDAHFFDRSVLMAFRNPADVSDPIGPPALEHAMADITALGGFTVLTLLVAGVAIYMLSTGRRIGALMIVGASLSGGVLSETLKALFERARPDLVPHLTHMASASFPSGHAFLSAVTYLTLGVLLAREHDGQRAKLLLIGGAVLLTLMIGASRVYLGVHWPTDVLAGWSLGAAWAALWWLAARLIDRRGERGDPSPSADR